MDRITRPISPNPADRVQVQPPRKTYDRGYVNVIRSFKQDPESQNVLSVPWAREAGLREVLLSFVAPKNLDMTILNPFVLIPILEDMIDALKKVEADDIVSVALKALEEELLRHRTLRSVRESVVEAREKPEKSSAVVSEAATPVAC